MRPGCICSRFDKIDFCPIFGPKVPPLQISNVRNLGFWFWVLGTPFGVFGSKYDQSRSQSIQFESRMRPGHICSRFGKIDFWPIFGPNVPPLQISNIRNSKHWFGYKVPHLALLDRNTIKIVFRTSKLSPTCVLGAFAVDLEKSIFGRFLDPRYLPGKSRKSGFWNIGLVMRYPMWRFWIEI